MSFNDKNNHPDIIILYNEHDLIEPIIDPLLATQLSFRTMPAGDSEFELIKQIQPKIIMLAHQQINQSVRYYVELLEHIAEQQFSHSAILLVANKDVKKAFFTCVNGLFDDFIIINPFNDKFRLQLLLLKTLSIIDQKRDNHISQLIDEESQELEACLNHGRELKQTLNAKINSMEQQLVARSKAKLDTDELNNIIAEISHDVFSQLLNSVNSQFESFIANLTNVTDIQTQIQTQVLNKLQTKYSINKQQMESNTNSNAKPQFSIVIADSSELFAKVVADIFKQENFKVYQALDGQEAYDLFVNTKPDAMILALNLSKLDGIELTKKIRQHQFGHQMPIIALSNNKDKAVIRKWIPYGLNAYLVKPSTHETIYKTVMHEILHPSKLLKNTQKAAETIKWIPEYSVGNEELDRHHQHLFSLINEYFVAQNDTQTLTVIFEKIEEYCHYHFDAEEKYMQQINYPKVIEHHQQHQKLIQKLDVMKNKLNQADSDIINRIGLFLYRWLSKHILTEDMEYKQFSDSQ